MRRADRIGAHGLTAAVLLDDLLELSNTGALRHRLCGLASVQNGNQLYSVHFATRQQQDGPLLAYRRSPHKAKKRTTRRWSQNTLQCSLENQLESELQAAPADAVRSDVASKGIATVLIEAGAAECARSNAVHARVGYAQPLVVEHVEGLSLELDRQALVHFGVLEHPQIGSADGLSPLGVASHSQEGRSEEFSGGRIVDDPVCLVQSQGIAGNQVHQAAVGRAGAGALAHRGKRGCRVGDDGTAGIAGGPRPIRWIAERGTGRVGTTNT